MSFTLPIRYFLVMVVMLLLTGMWMFALHTSFTIEGTLAYYAPKSLYGLLETVSPHFFGMGLIVFTLTHFFAIVLEVELEKYSHFSILFFLTLIVANLSGFFITEESLIFAVVKLIFTLLFFIFTLFAGYKLFKIA